MTLSERIAKAQAEKQAYKGTAFEKFTKMTPAQLRDLDKRASRLNVQRDLGK